MSNLLAARLQMAFSLGFHIIFAAIGIALPLMMAIAEGAWLRTGEPIYRELAKRWAKGAAILFAVGAVSGTVLSFELGLLWPGFMEFSGPIVGLGFGLEGFAFFTEAIFLGIYLYGWDRIPPRTHWLAGCLVALSGALSGVLVVSVNAWMNTPTGFRLVEGVVTEINPIAALLNPATFSEALHMTIASYAATGLLVAGVHAAMLLRDRDNDFHRKAMSIALVVGGTASILQPLSGHYSAQLVARTQPLKLAAMEGQFRTERRAPLRIGGIPDPIRETTRYAIEIPAALSILAFNDPNAEVKGLGIAPPVDRPPVAVVHIAFQLMVACGMAMLFVSLVAGWHAWRHRSVPDTKWCLIAILGASPLGMIAIEAGWTVTEVGRQPWIVQGVLRTAETVTPVPGLWISLASYMALYIGLGIVVVLMLMLQFRASPSGLERSASAGRTDR